MSFSTLPLEIIYMIAAHAENREVNALLRCSRHFHGLLQDWLYRRDVRSDGGSALYWAAQVDCIPTAILSLHHGANIDIQNSCRPRLACKDDCRGHEPGSACSALVAAAAGGSTRLVARLLAKGADPNQRVDEWRNGGALAAASYYGHGEIVRMLLNAGADHSERWGYWGSRDSALKEAVIVGNTDAVEAFLAVGAADDTEYVSDLLYWAVNNAQVAVLRLLLDNGVDPDGSLLYRGRCLRAAVAMGSEEMVKMLVEHGADVTLDTGPDQVLPLASLLGEDGLVEYLLASGADINANTMSLGPPLHAASSGGRSSTVRLLLNRGAKANTRGGRDNYPIIAAAHEGQTEILKMLVEAGADINARADMYSQCNSFSSALHAAASNGNVANIEYLLSIGADIHLSDAHSGTALHVAAGCAPEAVVRLLLANGADVNSQAQPDEGGRELREGTVLERAVYHERYNTVKLLLANGADINKSSQFHGGPLPLAAAHNEIDMVRMLLDNGADINLEASPGGSALRTAERKGFPNIAQLLRARGAR